MIPEGARMNFKFAVASGLALAGLCAEQALGATCEDLANFKSKDVTISAAKTVDAPGTIANNLAQAGIAAPFCRVNGFITLTKDSHIGFEVWLPAADKWNKIFQAVGNGGLS